MENNKFALLFKSFLLAVYRQNVNKFLNLQNKNLKWRNY